MITVKCAAAQAKMRAAGRVVEETLQLLERNIRTGVSTKALNDLAEDFIRSKGAIPSFLGYRGFPASLCVSVNEQVVHGIPDRYRLRDGDIVSCDVGAIFQSYHGDAARTFLVGQVAEEAQKLVRVTRECFFKGLKFCRSGYRVSDISLAIQRHAESHGYGVVRALTGHGIGTSLHEDPEVPNFFSPKARMRLQPGMTLAIEPMINMGTWRIRRLDDGWTEVTEDGLPSAHYENTVLITEGEPELLTGAEERP
ncbi:MAG: type I methionyl aminopeptidase [Clostridiales bacterium]|nr:type I methionyl aminopeptidase [Clostridiales bacterium]